MKVILILKVLIEFLTIINYLNCYFVLFINPDKKLIIIINNLIKKFHVKPTDLILKNLLYFHYLHFINYRFLIYQQKILIDFNGFSVN